MKSKVSGGLVSIMIPTFNRPQLFEMTLNSALAQDYGQVEILVCDNSTNDDTENLIQKYLSDPRLTYRRNKDAKTKEENFAPFESMAKGKYLQWLMDDDLLVPDKLSRMVEVLQRHPNVKLVTSQRGVIDANNELIDQKKCPFPVKKPYSIYPGEFATWMSLRDMLNLFGEPSTYLFRRKDLTHHYWRAEAKGLKVISDVAMALELLESGDVAIFSAPYSFYRRHAGQEGQGVDVVLLSRLEWHELNREYLQKSSAIYGKDDYRLFCSRIVYEYDHAFFQLKERAGRQMWERYTKFVEDLRRSNKA